MTRNPEPPSIEAHDRAWDFLTNADDDGAAEAFLEALQTEPEALDALVHSSEELLRYRSLGDAELRAAWACPDAAGLEIDQDLAAEHDPDQRLDAAIAAGDHRSASWARFRGFNRRRSAGITVGLMAAAAALFVLGQGTDPVPDYAGDWRNGAAITRATPGTPGVYLVGNEADLVIRPVTPMGATEPEVRVFVGRNGGALAPVDAEIEVGQSQAVRVLLPITPELGTGTHRVVVLVGSGLDEANPETDTDDWARFETTMQVQDAL